MGDASLCKATSCALLTASAAAETPTLFWRCFDELAASNPAVLKTIVGYMTQGPTRWPVPAAPEPPARQAVPAAPAAPVATLRGVNRSMRGAINRTVTTVACRNECKFDGFELATVFPEASHLRVIPGEKNAKNVTAAELATFLSHIVESSPGLLATIQTLELQLPSTPASDCLASSVAPFLSWCTKLSAISFNFSDVSLKFEGQGTTPNERHAHMQQQLAILSSSFLLLTPSTCPDRSTLFYAVSALADVELSLTLSAFMQATSLVSLKVCHGTTTAAVILQELSNLRCLTSLSIFTLPFADTSPVLAATPDISSLRTLPVDLPFSCLQLPALTSLQLHGKFSELGRLTWLQALRRLRLSDCGSPVGISLTLLFPLTRLTALICEFPSECEGQDAAAPGSNQQGRVVPPAWREGLQSLEWSCNDSSCTSVVAGLTCLTTLELHHVVMTEEACRALCELVHLRRLRLQVPSSATEAPCPSIPRELLPTLAAMAPAWMLDIFCEGLDDDGAEADLTPLHYLARWTNIQHPMCVFMIQVSEDRLTSGCCAIKGWGVNWVASALYSHLPSCGAPLLLVDDADVALLLEALKVPHEGESLLTLHLGQAISPTAFCSLLGSEHLPCKALTISRPPNNTPLYVEGWTGRLEPTTEHFTQLLVQAPRATLHRLSVDGCQQLEDVGVAALASVEPELRHLELFGAERLGDASLAALAVGCPHLESLVVVGAGQVTAAGLLLLLRVAKTLQRVELRGMGAGAALRLRGHLLRMLAVASSTAWAWSVSKAFMPWLVLQRKGEAVGAAGSGYSQV